MTVRVAGATSQRGWGVGIGLLLVALAYFGLLAPYGLNVGEEGATVYLIFRTLNGQRPYIDFISGYTPAYFYWHALLLEMFGTNLLAIRFCVALVNSASVLLLYTVARTFVPARLALLPACAYLALLPVVPWISCSFNVPYPSWYAVLFWLIGVSWLLHWLRTGQGRWVLAAGVLAGISFSFKPNTGLFNLAADVLCVALACDPRRAAGVRGRAVVDRVLWYGVLAVVVAGVLVVFRAHLSGREGLIFVAPIAALMGAWIVRGTAPEGADGSAPNPSCGVWQASALLTVGFGAVTVPWLAYFFVRLGWARFSHDVLFVNTGYEQFFYLPYRFLAGRDMLVAAGLAGMALGAVVIRRGWVSARVVLAALGGGVAALVAWLWLAAPMPEGFQRSVLLRVQDASFGVALLIHWTLTAAAWRRRRRGTDSALQRSLSVVLVSALFMYLGVYPRSDFFHLVFSVPLTLILGTVLLHRLLQRWRAAVEFTTGRRLEVLCLAACAALLVIIAAPQLGLCGQVVRHYLRPGSDNDTLVQVALRRAPVLVQRGVAGQAVADLAPVVDYLDQHTGEDDGLFTFPDLDLIGVLAGRNTPARIGYFKPGWPDHLIEADVVAALAARPPRFAVVARRASLFFADAPVYYFVLRDFIANQYRLWARIGQYDVLLRKGVEVPPAAVTAPREGSAPATACAGADVRRCLREGNRTVVRQVIEAVRESETAGGAAALSEAWASGWLARPELPEATGLLALRVVSEVGDARAAAPLLAVVPGDQPQRDAVASALFNITIRELIEPYQFGNVTDEARGAAEVRFGHERELRDWLGSAAADVRLRFFAAWALTAAGGAQEDGGMRRKLEALAEDPNVALQLAGGVALAQMSASGETLDRLLRLAEQQPSLLPSLALEWSRRHPETAAPLLSRILENGEAAQRETVAFIAGVLRWPALVPGLQKTAGAAETRVRLASIWALGRTGDAAAVPVLRAALGDTDERVRRFAERALGEIIGGA